MPVLKVAEMNIQQALKKAGFVPHIIVRRAGEIQALQTTGTGSLNAWIPFLSLPLMSLPL